MIRLLNIFMLLASTNAFSYYKKEELPDSLADACSNALTSAIKCDKAVQDFAGRKYHGSLESEDLTNTVCSGNCYASLRDWFYLVSDVCTGVSVDGRNSPTLTPGYMWEGFNETCVKDPRTKKYCNDIIDQFTDVDRTEDMPKDELCSICFVRKLALMQSSQYSAYDQFYLDQLQYVYSHCDMQGPTDILPALVPQQDPPRPICLTGSIYTTRGGESCESIANDTSVAGSNLYMANQAVLTRCSNLSAGIDICLPLTCDTYFIRPRDNCTSIETDLTLLQGELRQYNPWINFDCSNLQSATDFYGKSICVSPQGGTFTATRLPIQPTPNPDSGDGYTLNAIRPPTGARVARGTTLNCGKWYVVQANDACSTICTPNRIDIHLFLKANPSLADSDCTSKLVGGTAVCVGPTYGWDTTATEGATITVSPTSTSTPSSSQAVAPTTTEIHE